MDGVHDFIRVPPRTIVCLKEPWLVPPARIALLVWFNEPSSLVLGGLRRTIPAAIARVTSEETLLSSHECLATGATTAANLNLDFREQGREAAGRNGKLPGYRQAKHS